MAEQENKYVLKTGAPLVLESSLAAGYHVDKNLAWNLNLWKKAVTNQDIDCCIFIDGKEGGGKSVLAQQIAEFLDINNKISIDRICFTPEEVGACIQNLPKGYAVIYDEAQRGFNRRNSNSEDNVKLMNLLAECRQKNLFLIIVMPSFYNADMVAAVWRTRLLIHVTYDWNLDKPEKPLVRGFARFYSERGKKMLYCNNFNRKYFNYPYLKDDSFDFHFPHHYCVDEDAYRKKKLLAVEAYKQEAEPKKTQKAETPVKHKKEEDYTYYPK